MSTRRLLGVDVGGTGIKFGLVEVDAKPRLVASDAVFEHAGESPAAALTGVANRLRALMDRHGWETALGVGVGSAGLIRRSTGEVVFSPNLPTWTNAQLIPPLKDVLHLPVSVDNDVHAFALGEWMWGAGERSPNAIFLTLGTGIGAGLVVGGRLVRGAEGFAGEPGHATLVLDGIPCPCGNKGCAERYVGNNDIVRRAREHVGFSANALSKINPLTPRELSVAAENGNELAREVLAEAGGALGGLLVSLVNTLNPERVVIGGGVAQAGSWLLDPARRHLAKRSLVARYSPPKILTAALGKEAGLLGAAALVLDDVAASSL